MADTRSTTEREAARSRAQTHFAASEQRDAAIKQIIEGERAAAAAKTARLRKLRLAKEEADRAAAAEAPQSQTKSPAKRKRALRTR